MAPWLQLLLCLPYLSLPRAAVQPAWLPENHFEMDRSQTESCISSSSSKQRS